MSKNDIPGYTYRGDVSIKEGGVYLPDITKEVEASRKEGKTYEDWVDMAEVDVYSDEDNQWVLQHLRVQVVIKVDENIEDTMMDCLRCNSVDLMHSEIVQIGNPGYFKSHNYREPDVKYRANKRLINVVKAFVAEHI